MRDIRFSCMNTATNQAQNYASLQEGLFLINVSSAHTNSSHRKQLRREGSEMKTGEERVESVKYYNAVFTATIHSPLSLFSSGFASGPGCKRISSWRGHLLRTAVRKQPSLPGGHICYNTNITEATDEFLKSTIKSEQPLLLT